MGRALELSVQQPETENRWGEEPGFSLRGFIRFYFMFLMSNWLRVPAAVVFSARLDVIRLLSFLWPCRPLNPSPPLSSTLTLFFFSFITAFFCLPFVTSSYIPRFSNHPSSHLSSPFFSPLLFPSPATLRLNSSLPPSSSTPPLLLPVLHPLHPLIAAHGMTG